jgi:hypothetical protein
MQDVVEADQTGGVALAVSVTLGGWQDVEAHGALAAVEGRLEHDRVDALRSQLELLGTPVLAVIVDGG